MYVSFCLFRTLRLSLAILFSRFRFAFFVLFAEDFISPVSWKQFKDNSYLDVSGRGVAYPHLEYSSFFAEQPLIFSCVFIQRHRVP